MKLVSLKALEDLFKYGINDMAVLGDQELDGKVLEILRQQQTIPAVPYYKIAQTILKIRALNSNFDYVPRKEVISLLWQLIDGKEKDD